MATRKLSDYQAPSAEDEVDEPVIPYTERRFRVWPTIIDAGGAGGSPPATSITSGGGAWVGGTWNNFLTDAMAPLEGNETSDVLLVGVRISNPSNSGEHLFLVGSGPNTGGLGSTPDRLVGEFPFTVDSGVMNPSWLTFPVPVLIQSGSRIYIRLYADGASRTVRWQLLYYRGPLV